MSRTGVAFGRAARAVVWLRFPIVVLWIAAAFFAATHLPSIFAAESDPLNSLLPRSSAALVAERKAFEEFGTPLITRTVVVATQERPLRVEELSGAFEYALRRDRVPLDLGHLRAVPLVNAPKITSESESVKAFVCFLYLDPRLSEVVRENVSTEFAEGLRAKSGIETVDVTGASPAGRAQEQIGNERLLWLELATLAVVVGVLAYYFGALGIPVLGVAAVAIAYLIADHVLGWLAEHTGLGVPSEVDPVIVALLFGTLTDYVVFFASGWRRRLAEGEHRRDAAVDAASELMPVVLAAALMIAGAISVLLISGVRFLSEFAPGMAISVLIGAAVALTFVPSVLAIGGERLLWPRGSSKGAARDAEQERRRASLPLRIASRWPRIVSLACVLALLAGASGLLHIELGNPLIRGLPSSSSPRRGYEEVSKALGPGIVGPTMLVVHHSGLSSRDGRLARLEGELEGQQGVGAVLGPGKSPLPGAKDMFVAADGRTARFGIVFETDPTGTHGIRLLSALEADLPAMLDRAGLGEAETELGGDTTIAAELNDRTEEALLRVAPAALIVLVFVLALLLRSLTTPLYLVAVSVLVVAAAVGSTVYFFQGLLEYDELVFFVPVASAILLLALGSDYNVFLVSRVWRQSGRMGLRPAIRTAGSRASHDITIAGLTLALSFAAVVIVPILSFRELAFTMCAGLLIDVFVARTLLIPALMALFGLPGAGEEEAGGEPLRSDAARGAT